MPIAIAGQRFCPGHERQEDIGGLKDLKAGRQDAHDCVGLRIEIDGLPNDVLSAAEPALPKTVAQQDNGSTTSAIFFGQEGSADLRVNSQQGKQARRGHSDVQPLRLSRARQGDGAAAGGFHGFEGVTLIAPVQIILVRGRYDGEGTFFSDENETRGITKWKWAQEDAVYDAKDGGVRSDAQRERKNGDGGEAGALCEEPEGVANVLHQSEHGFSRGANLPHLSDGYYEQSLPMLVCVSGAADTSVRV